jgi:hypothetical protein
MRALMFPFLFLHDIESGVFNLSDLEKTCLKEGLTNNVASNFFVPSYVHGSCALVISYGTLALFLCRPKADGPLKKKGPCMFSFVVHSRYRARIEFRLCFLFFCVFAKYWQP